MKIKKKKNYYHMKYYRKLNLAKNLKKKIAIVLSLKFNLSLYYSL